MKLKTLLNKYKCIGLLLVSMFIIMNTQAQEVTEKTVELKDIIVKVTDQDGNSISEASIIVGEGIIHTVTNIEGGVSFRAKMEDFVTISKPGYEKKVMLVSDLTSNNVITLSQAKLFMTSDDLVPLPFMSISKRHLTGSSNVIKGNMFEKYPSTDFRNSLTGLATGLEVSEMNGSPGISAEEKLALYGIDEKVNVMARGLDIRYIIDEIPTDITEMPLDPSEIESVTVIKDIVGKSMYGAYGADGIVFIKTKRGRPNERILNANAEYGVNMVDRFPEWTSGAEYAELNNIARTNSGLTPLYSESDIAAYAKNDPYDMYHPSVDYKSLLFKDNMEFKRVNISSTGGSDKVQYYSYLGYNGEGDIYKLGSTADYNRLNARSNIDIQINDVLKAQFDFFGGFSYRRSPNYGWDPEFTSDNASDNPVLTITELPMLLNDIGRTPPIEFPVYANNDESLKYPWYAVSTNYPMNPIGGVEKNGYYTESGRNGTFNIALDADLGGIIDGLKARTYVGFSNFTLLRIGKAEDYTAYRITPSVTSEGADTILLNFVHDGVDQAAQAKLHDFYYQRWAAYENLNYQKRFGRNELQASLTYYLSKVARNGIEEPYRQMITSFVAAYSFDDKYNIQGVVNSTGSSSFSENERYFLSPTIGASWVISEENFIKNIQAIDYLKLRAEYGVLGYESFRAPYGYRDRWNNNSSGQAFGPFSANQWFGSSTDNQVYRTVPSRIGNPDLGWEKRKEFNAGIDLLLANRSIFMEVNYYNQLRDNMISRYAKLPYIAGISSWSPVANYNQIKYTGVEASLTYTKNIGSLKYSVTGRASLPKAEWVKYDEPNYRYDYQKREGDNIYAIRGLTYLGRFASDEEAMQVPQLFDDVLHTDDLKYKDMNGDGVVDDNDYSSIGNSYPKFLYGIDIRLNYRNVELTLIGTGKAFFDILLSGQYFQNGWGDNNYSKFVYDNVMNNGTEYPKLTYYRVNNNFETSDFWIRDGGYFKIQNVELAWNIPVSKMQWVRIRGIKLYARGANLFTFSKLKDVDPESIYSGVYDYPLFKTVSGGVKLTF